MLLMLLYGPTSSDKKGLCLGFVVTSPVVLACSTFPLHQGPSAKEAAECSRCHHTHPSPVCVCQHWPGSSARGQQTP